VDLIASASADQYREAIRIVGRDPGVDAVIVIFIPPLVTRADDVARALIEGARALDGSRTLLSVFMQARGVPEALRAPEVRIPSFAFPEEAALALARAARWGEWLARPVAVAARPAGLHPDDASALVAAARKRGADWLEPAEVARVLAAYGLPVLDQRVAATPAEAEAAARALGGAVALKAIAPGVVHKTEAGAVQLGLAPDQVADAARAMSERLAAGGRSPTGYLVQQMAADGIEMLVGVVADRQFGPVVACGAGGVLVDLVKDLSVRLTPISHGEARAMIDELRVRPLLAGYRGEPPGDVETLADVIVRVGTMVDDLPDIAELDLNPVRVHERGATVVDARIRLAGAR
jgi:acyl-CoA synthetase (NDP forming)